MVAYTFNPGVHVARQRQEFFELQATLVYVVSSKQGFTVRSSQSRGGGGPGAAAAIVSTYL